MKNAKRFLQGVVMALLFVFVIGCNTQNKEQKKVVQPEETAKTEVVNHEVLIDSLIESLSGIEYHFVKYKEVFNNEQYITDNLLNILSYQKHKKYDELKNLHMDKYQINILDQKNGFIVAQGLGVENVTYLTYWTIKDGSGEKLLAEVNRGCGPACEDYIRFYKIFTNKTGNSAYRYEKLERSDIIQGYDKLAEQLLGHEIDDYYPISYNLPRGGKNILVCYANDINLNPEDDEMLEQKGTCVDLIWHADKGIFIPEEQSVRK